MIHFLTQTKAFEFHPHGEEKSIILSAKVLRTSQQTKYHEKASCKRAIARKEKKELTSNFS